MCCRVSVRSLEKLASELAKTVVDTSWMTKLDKGTQRAYEYTVSETAKVLCDIFSSIAPDCQMSEEFGELMVSMGSARALRQVFGHAEIPLAELWKPQIKQNEGFDFHTVCGSGMLNFGEAKYSSISSPHGAAIIQASKFISAQKHLRDYVHLSKICPGGASLLDEDKFGVVAAFSLCGVNHNLIMANAMKSAISLASDHGLTQVFLVGVSNDA